MSAAWILAACGLLMAGGGAWAAWPLMKGAPARPEQGGVPMPEIEEQPFPRTGAHWLDGWVVSGNGYL